MTPKKTQTRKVRPRSVEDLMQFLDSFEPDPEFAASLRAAIEKRHIGFEDDEGGPRERRRSTRKS